MTHLHYPLPGPAERLAVVATIAIAPRSGNSLVIAASRRDVQRSIAQLRRFRRSDRFRHRQATAVRMRAALQEEVLTPHQQQDLQNACGHLWICNRVLRETAVHDAGLSRLTLLTTSDQSSA